MAKTTKKQFKIFKKEALKIAKQFGIIDWQINFEHKKLDKGVAANCQTDFDSHLAVISFTAKHDDDEDFSNKWIKFYARHEALHILFARIVFIGKARYINGSELDEEEHGLIRTLENVVFK